MPGDDEPARSEARVKPRNPLRIFIVEDNLTIRHAMVESLQELVGALIVGVSGGEANAVAQLNALGHGWDVALVDLFLEEGSGIGVIRKIARRLPCQKALVLSNYATPDTRERCLALGADAVFDKSTELDQLFDDLEARH